MSDMSDPRLPTAPDHAATATPANGLDPEMPALPAEIPAVAITSVLKGLRNLRHYQDTPIPDDVLHEILEVARWSGSAHNAQPWSFVIVRDRAILADLARQPGWVRHVDRAPIGIMLVMDGAPDGESAETFDEGRLTERIMLAAAAHGLVSSIAWFSGDGETVAKTLLGIPDERLVRTLVSIGYADDAAIAANPGEHGGRKPLSEIVHDGRW